ncbi:3'-5' exonuclease domain [Quillaja saponaria]|uniref:3'-5' exonuclease domain n=1 Tax=Quillaja saponaria TaxID=32244 RepID=A0AAD7LRR9_QUISA|nr:3'-5' exonuclease domain [Quillaja saponaria]
MMSYLVNAIVGETTLIKECKPALESNVVTKVIHDCKGDSEVSTEIAYFILCFLNNRARQDHLMTTFPMLAASFADPRYCGT